MADKEVMTIQTRLGPREVRLESVILFPRGIIGFEHLRNFTLLQVKEDAPLFILQSLEAEHLGLLVADPFAFVPDYSLHINNAEQELLQAENAADLAVLVTATIPPGKPEQTALNLLGPIAVNHKCRIGLQIPQTGNGPTRVFIHSREVEAETEGEPKAPAE